MRLTKRISLLAAAAAFTASTAAVAAPTFINILAAQRGDGRCRYNKAKPRCGTWKSPRQR
ncbi:hypothetical protein SSTU70S_07063 [Stutzerimonas stutzeri]